MSGLGAAALRSATELLGCLEKQIEEAGLVAPCVLTVMPGADVAIDFGLQCDEGMAWVRVSRIAQAEGAVPLPGCSVPWDVSFEMGWMGPAAPVTDDGQGGLVLPSSEEHYASTTTQFEQADLMATAITCCRLTTGWRLSLGSYEPFGPQGGVVGGLWLGTMHGD